MTIELLIDRKGPLLRAATLEDGRLTDLQVDHDERPSLLGAVFLGRVERIVPGLDGAFVDLGADRSSGLLNASDVRLPGADSRKAARAPARPVGKLLRGGQPVLVQVKAEPGGTKGPTLTMDVTLPGRFLVMTPLTPGIALSRRIAQGEARARLLRMVEEAVSGGGWIVRSGALGAGPDLLAREADWLSRIWRDVEAAAAAGAPAQLAHGPDAARRAMLGQGGGQGAGQGGGQGGRLLDAIVTGDDALFRDVRDWCAAAAPDLADRVVRHTERTALFERHDLEGALAELTRRTVPLAGGGSIVVDRTEAMTVIDVNGGERANALSVNLQAAREVARQLRLRNLAGIVVVDFIDMRGRGDRERLLAELADAVIDDPAAPQVYGMTKLGLVEMTRARRGPAVPDLLLASSPRDAT